MRERICVSQFIHPGGEHGGEAGGTKAWNTGPHKRKFLQAPGRYVDADDTFVDAEIVFWGEWEPPSAVSRISHPLEEGPRWIHRPLLDGIPPVGAQNTDPYVFGDGFRFV